MLGVELLVIDAETTMRQFLGEIRANQAYYRLAQGL
jgi:L-arabinose isomerase